MRVIRTKALIPAPKDGMEWILDVSPTQLATDASGNFKSGSTVTVSVYIQKGEGQPTQEGLSDYQVEVYKDGSSTMLFLKREATFSFTAVKTAKRYDIKLKVHDSYIKTVTLSISADGSNGESISTVTEYYLASANSSGVTRDTNGWTTSIQTVTATNKYLWNYERVVYSNGTIRYTDPVVIGTYGDKGVGISSVTEYYLATSSASGITRDTNGWTTTVQNVTESNKYLWNYERITYTDGTTQDTDPVIIGVYGNTGTGISSITEYYLAINANSGVTRSTSGWTTSIQTVTASKKYLWNYEKITYSDGSSDYTDPVVIGTYGDKGVSISYVTEYYLATSAASGVTRNTSGWTTNPTSAAATISASKKYLWNYEVIGYSDGSTDETDPVIIGMYGDKGDPGNPGDPGTGIYSTTWYYLATTMVTGVTRSTSGWTTSYQQGTPDLPYVWRYGDTLLTNGTHQYTDCEMIFSYSAGANPNLLEQTNFSSLQALDKWTTRNQLSPLSGISLPQENYASITTGIQAHNAYYDRTSKTTAQIQYKEVLQQCLWSVDGKIRKLEPSTWYTLSFWAKGNHIATFIYPSVFNRASVCYIDGVMQAANTLGTDAYIMWNLTSSWVKHTFTFKTKSSMSGDDQKLLFRLYPKASSGITNNVYLCMPKLEVGMQATSYISNEESTHFGQIRRRRWALNTEYFCGGVDERYDDTVLFGETGFYHCIKTHISNNDNAPNGTYGSLYWSSAERGMYEMLSTDIFLAEKALINNLIATLIQTGYSGTPHIEAEGSEFKIFGKGQYPAIYLAVNDNDQAVLRFQNENTGEFLYDLGPDGIMKEFSEVADSYTPMKLKKLTNVTRISEIINITDSACTTYYRFNEGYKQIGSGSNATKQYHVSGGSSPSAKNTQFFTSQNYNGTKISNGWYVKPNNGNYIQQLSGQYVIGNNGLYEDVTIYMVTIYQFSNGKLVTSVPVYFLQTDSQYATHSVGCDENGNELSTSTYSYLYSYWMANNVTL